MPGPQVDIELPDGTTGTIDADPALIEKAISAGVKKFGEVPIVKGEESGSVTGDYLPKALAAGWSIRGAEPAPALTLEASLGMTPPDPMSEPAPAPAPAPEERWPVTLESVDPATMQASQKDLERERFARGIAAQKEREAAEATRERIHGAGLGSLHSAGNLVGTAGEGLARGAMIGSDLPMALAQGAVNTAVDYIAPANPDVPLTLDHAIRQAREDITDRAETNPVTATLSEIGGMALPALATAGASAPAAAAGGGARGLAQRAASLAERVAARMPAAKLDQAAGRLGTKAAVRLGLTGRALEGVGLSGTLARIAAPAAKLGVEGGVEGAGQGLVSTVNDMWRRDDYEGALGLLAQGTLENSLLGSGLGLGAGTALGTRGAIKGPEAGKQMVRKLGLTTERPPPGIRVGEEPLETYPKPVEPEGARGLTARTLKLTPEAASKLRDTKHTNIVKNANELFRLQDHIDNDLDLAAKKRFVLAHATEPADDLPLVAIREESGLTRPFFEKLAADTPIRLDPKSAGVVATLTKQFEAIESDLFETATQRPLTRGDVFIAVDQYKRYMQKAASWANDNGRNYLFDILDPKAEELRHFLTDNKIWPEAVADMQRRTNAAQTRAIAAAKDADLAGMLGPMGVKSDFNNYDLKRKIRDGWLTNHTTGLGTPQEAQRVLAFNRWLNAITDDAAIRAGAYGSDELQETAEKINRARLGIQNDMGTIEAWNTAAASRAGPRMPTSKKLGALVGSLPGTTYALEGAIERARTWAHKKSVDTLAKVDAAAELRAILKSPKTSLPGYVVKTAASQKELGAGVERYLEQLHSNDPDAGEDESLAVLEASFGPQMAGAASQLHATRKAFLRSKAAEKGPGAKESLRRYTEAALRPVDAIERLAGGAHTPEDLETLKALYPTLYQRFAEGAMKALQSTETTYDQRLRVSRALGLDAEPSLDPAHVEALQSLATSGAGEPNQSVEPAPVLSPSQRRPPKVSDMHTRGVPP